MTKINEAHITVDTTTPALSIGEIQLSADRRNVEGQPKLADRERIRRVVLPAGTWGELTAHHNRQNNSQALVDVLTAAIKKLAGDKLRDYLENEPLARTVPVAAFTIPAILAWSTETAASRNSLTVTREQITSWFATSALHTAMRARGPEYVALVQQRCEALAANNHGLKTLEQVSKLVVLLADDAKHPTVVEMLGRLASIERAISERTKGTTKVTLDDL